MAESPTSNQPLTSSAINIEENSMEKKSKKTFTCMSPGCTKIFAANYNLKRHMIKAHKINAISDNLNIKCLHPTCTNQFVHVTKMLTHLEDEHGVEIQREKLTFKTLDEFYKWKENEQTTNFVYFSKYQGVATPKDGDSVVLYFKCQRDGSNRPHRASGHTPKTNKTRGSVKMNMVCPARMVVKVSKNDGTVMVEYIQSHSHPITAEDSRRQPMPSSLREDIERKLSAGMTEDEIMTELTGGTYLPTGKQGDRSMKDRRGDRSSINYGIPVDSGIYFINKKRLSTMKRRLKVPIAADPGGVPSGGPPAKKRKTVDEAALELAAIKGQLKQLSEYLDDEAVREAVLPDVHSLVTYLLQSCATAKKGESLDASQQSSDIVGGEPTVALQSVPYEQAASSQTVDKSDAEDSEPTVYFSDGKNVIKVAIKRRCKDGNKPRQ
ncbi:uncharacterized protein [Amphiura filiformis]|uniref:uncharacterized protein n=1 Tax=Amphiura filiformis TaxID=82378 RepID=UPI003B22666B